MNIRDITKTKKLVVKVGTSTLTHENGSLNLRLLEELVRVLSDLNNRGISVVLVTSGAIGVGLSKMGIKHRPDSIPERQAAAAVGQCELMAIYDKLFLEYGQIVAQILLTKDVIENETRHNNAKNTLGNLLARGVIPIVNENDTISTDEIELGDKFGDNDTLSAFVAQLTGAELLVLLTDIDGLYSADPKINPDATIIPIVDKIDESIEALAGGAGSKLGTGGMITKIKAAKIATESGISMIIANGKSPQLLYDIFDGKQVGTLFR